MRSLFSLLLYLLKIPYLCEKYLLMDSFLQSLYTQYNDLLTQKQLLDLNLTKVGELILLNKGTLPTGQPRPAAPPIEKVAITEPPAEKKSKPYNPDMNWQDKILYVLTGLNTSATAKQIAIKIRELEPHTQLSVEKSVELTTSRMSNAGIIGAKKEGVKNYYYILLSINDPK